MNLMKIIESVDEALYTVMSWLVLYPLTLWRTLVATMSSVALIAAARRLASGPGRLTMPHVSGDGE